MAVNQTKILVLSPEEAYGSPVESLIETRFLSESIPILQLFGNTTTFFDTYQMDAIEGANVKNLVYGWNMTVFHVDALSGNVILKNNPFFGEIIQSQYGWSSKVVSIDSSANLGTGEIVIRHILTAGDIGTKFFNDETKGPFQITEIDSIAGTFTVDFNREVVGKTLKFKITLVSLTPAP
jgi:hypothetical protein